MPRHDTLGLLFLIHFTRKVLNNSLEVWKTILHLTVDEEVVVEEEEEEEE